ncbi:MAG: orotidine-5'-phosphate decarboxylase [Spirochaetes bacterium]|nr:orotidine-5'-phosphate decarboxylase [Spirochaetota bacterium]
MSYLSDLKIISNKKKSIICMGMDPILEQIPISKKSIQKTIFFFYENILNEILRKNIHPACVKPNFAFYAQYGFEGLKALKELVDLYRSEGFQVILDAKRGDIGTTATAYAYEVFDFFNADAVTLAPYMGYDSVEPFMTKYPDRGYYVLCKTSNKSSADIQDLEYNGKPLFLKTAELITEWYQPGIGAVTGATYPEELKKIIKIFNKKQKDIPLLIPGIGSQGGSLEKVIKILNEDSDISLHRINASSSINYAYKKYPNLSFAEAAVEEIKTMNDQINSLIMD